MFARRFTGTQAGEIRDGRGWKVRVKIFGVLKRLLSESRNVRGKLINDETAESIDEEKDFGTD